MRPTLDELVRLRASRRELLTIGALLAATPRLARARSAEPSPEISEGLSVAAGHRVHTLLAWGDPILEGTSRFDPRALDAPERRFGYNCDLTVFTPLGPDRGILTVNHEYTDAALMLAGCDRRRARRGLTERETALMMAAHGLSVVELERRSKRWAPVIGALNRRVTATTPIRISGPAAGHARLKTSEDPSGALALGTISNCGGGVTPWGTVLSCEENFQQSFAGPTLQHGQEGFAHARYGIGWQDQFGWGRYHARFSVLDEPNEANRFGWVVEIDPRDPRSTPVKRTALGRFFHECAACALAPSGEVVVYSSDDGAFEYLYRFVSRGRYRAGEPTDALLDEGTLSVARFRENGELDWLPLVFGEGPLDAKRGFGSQADVLIEARRAADLLGATPLDRPEGVAVDPRSGRVYVALSKNRDRGSERADAANPRGPNPYGHVLAIDPPKGAHAAGVFRWEIVLFGGDESLGSDAGWLACPDNVAVDPSGRLWIATDGQESVERADGLHLFSKGALTRLVSGPRASELTGPSFTPDGRTLFLAVQHPGEGSELARPSTRWPDFDPKTPPRPAVVVIEREDGGPIGGG